jgi:hypothetical protein
MRILNFIHSLLRPNVELLYCRYTVSEVTNIGVSVFNLTELIELLVFYHIFIALPILMGAHGSVVVKALCYKPEGHGFKSR